MVIKTKIQKTIAITIKVAIVIAVYVFLYYQFIHNDRLESLRVAFTKIEMTTQTIFLFCFIVLLMFVNWTIEAIKWRLLMRAEESISIPRSLMAVFSGITVSIFTPNRTGEFLGRVFALKTTSPWRAIILTIVGSYSQILVTLGVGFISVNLFMHLYILPLENLPTSIFYCITTIVGGIILLLFLIYMNIGTLYDIINKILSHKRWRKIRLYLSVISRLHKKKLMVVFGLSLLRYMVFSLQFILILKSFKLPVSSMEAFIIISTLYFIMMAIPSITLAELGIRGTIIVFLFTAYFNHYNIYQSHYDIEVFSASSILWIINLAIPAILGSICIFQLQFFKK